MCRHIQKSEKESVLRWKKVFNQCMEHIVYKDMLMEDFLQLGLCPPSVSSFFPVSSSSPSRLTYSYIFHSQLLRGEGGLSLISKYTFFPPRFLPVEGLEAPQWQESSVWSYLNAPPSLSSIWLSSFRDGVWCSKAFLCENKIIDLYCVQQSKII